MAEFLDNVMGGINKGIKTISSKSKELVETTRLKSEINQIEHNIDGKFQALGKKVYSMLNKKAFNEVIIELDCADIAALYKKIAAFEEEIAKVEKDSLKIRHGDDAIRCAQCGTPNKIDDKFCVSCGTAISISDKAKDKACSTCGTAIKEGSKFCPKCGGRIA